MVDSSMVKLTLKSKFALLCSFQVEFERVVNRSKIISVVNLNVVYQVLTWWVTGAKKVYIFGPKSKNAICDGTPLTCMLSLVY